MTKVIKRGDNMEEEYWARFLETGSVADYLNYREAAETNQMPQRAAQGESYDGKYYSDRNDSVSRTNGRV